MTDLKYGCLDEHWREDLKGLKGCSLAGERSVVLQEMDSLK
jgi:hypothetical protein